jgi:hypothetical protein
MKRFGKPLVKVVTGGFARIQAELKKQEESETFKEKWEGF